MENKIEYINKSVLTKEQKNEIEEIVINRYNDNKKMYITITLVINIILILTFIFLCFSLYLQGNEDIIDMILFFGMGLAGINLIMLFATIYEYDYISKEYLLIRTKIIEKQVGSEGKTGNRVYKAIVKEGMTYYKLRVLNEELYNMIEKEENRIYVVQGKKKNNKIKGTIILDITDMIKGE